MTIVLNVCVIPLISVIIFKKLPKICYGSGRYWTNTREETWVRILHILRCFILLGLIGTIVYFQPIYYNEIMEYASSFLLMASLIKWNSV